MLHVSTLFGLLENSVPSADVGILVSTVSLQST